MLSPLELGTISFYTLPRSGSIADFYYTHGQRTTKAGRSLASLLSFSDWTWWTCYRYLLLSVCAPSWNLTIHTDRPTRRCVENTFSSWLARIVWSCWAIQPVSMLQSYRLRNNFCISLVWTQYQTGIWSIMSSYTSEFWHDSNNGCRYKTSIHNKQRQKVIPQSTLLQLLMFSFQ